MHFLNSMINGFLSVHAKIEYIAICEVPLPWLKALLYQCSHLKKKSDLHVPTCYQCFLIW